MKPTAAVLLFATGCAMLAAPLGMTPEQWHAQQSIADRLGYCRRTNVGITGTTARVLRGSCEAQAEAECVLDGLPEDCGRSEAFLQCLERAQRHASWSPPGLPPTPGLECEQPAPAAEPVTGVRL